MGEATGRFWDPYPSLHFVHEFDLGSSRIKDNKDNEEKQNNIVMTTS